MRAMIWMCPGFGAGAAAVGLEMLKRRGILVPIDLMLAAGMIAVLLTAGFAWFDVMMNPEIPKPEGRPALRESCRAIILYGLGQLIVAPVLSAGTVACAEIAGWTR